MSSHERDTAENGEPAAAKRALVAVSGAQQTSAPPAPQRAANFLAHLIATKAQAPQTRLRRRAEPAEALAAYRKTAGLR